MNKRIHFIIRVGMEVRECFGKEIYLSKIGECAKRMEKYIKEQKSICDKYKAEYVESPNDLKLE